MTDKSPRVPRKAEKKDDHTRPLNDMNRTPNAPEVPPNAQKPRIFTQTANAHRKFLMCKRAKFLHT